MKRFIGLALIVTAFAAVGCTSGGSKHDHGSHGCNCAHKADAECKCGKHEHKDCKDGSCELHGKSKSDSKK